MNVGSYDIGMPEFLSGVVGGLIGLGLVWLAMKLQHPSSRFLGWRVRRYILKTMSEAKSTPIEDVVMHIAYLAGKHRFSEADVWDLVKKLDYPPSEVEQIISSLAYQKKLQRDMFVRIVAPHEYIFYMPKASQEAYALELKKRAKDPEPERKDLSAELQSLVSSVRDAHEKAFLDETINCLEVHANRAAIVMGWNLAYHHLRRWIIAKHLPAFNAQLLISHPKRYGPATCHDDFPDKEMVTLEVSRAAGLLDGNRNGFLEGALKDRNRYAHPSPLHATGPEAVGYVSKLVKNVIVDQFFH